MYFPVLTPDVLIQRCEEMFNRPRDCSPVRRVLVFGVIFELCMEYSEDDKSPSLACKEVHTSVESRYIWTSSYHTT
jgi:hypothetical protein